MSDAKADANPPRPFSAPEGTWAPEDWPVDVQRVDENGVDLEQVEYQLSLTPAERLSRLEAFVNFVLTTRQRNGVRAWCDSETS